MSVLSDPTVVIEQTPPTEIQLNGQDDGSPEAATIDPELLENAPSTTDSIEDGADLQIEAPGIPSVTQTAPSVPLRKRNVRGRYRSSGTGWQLELRVDIDGCLLYTSPSPRDRS